MFKTPDSRQDLTPRLTPRTARALDPAIGERAEGPLFAGVNGDRMTRDAATRIVRQIAKAAGISKRIGPHSLRHSFITAALDAGADNPTRTSPQTDTTVSHCGLLGVLRRALGVGFS